MPARRRFSAETLSRAARSFAWGPHEARALTSHYPDVAPTRVVATGGPRADLWRPELDAYHRDRPLTSLGGRAEYLLVSSNFSVALDVNPFWVRIRDKRQHFVGPEDAFEFDRYPHTARKFLVLGEFVRAVRRLAAAHPDVLVVVRPHPIEARGAWRDLVGDVPNVLVTRERTLATWVRGARAVIQNECTSAYEAAVGGVPVIAFHPDGLFADHPPNALGRRASDQDELAALVTAALDLDPADRAAWMPDDGRALLSDRLAALDGRFASDRIVDEWEAATDDRAAGPPWDLATVLRARRRLARRDAAARAARAARDVAARRRSRPDPEGEDERPTGAFAAAHKFPPLRQADVDGIVDGLRRTLGRFADVEARVVAPDLVTVTPRPGGRRHGGSRP